MDIVAHLGNHNNIDFCQVNISVTHHHSSSYVHIGIRLPEPQVWNGRLQAGGGGDFATGMFFWDKALQQNWAIACTNGGHNQNSEVASWALNEDRSINWDLLHNFGSRSLVDMIVIGKEIFQQYYRNDGFRTYWRGCSTGGCQGYATAQRYPHLVDGILANAPAIRFTHIVTGGFLPQLLMQMHGTFMSRCEWSYVQQKAIEHCDKLDAALDGILEDPSLCDFDPHSLADGNHTFCCEGQDEAVECTVKMAELAEQMHKGPAWSSDVDVFSGFAYGIDMGAVANITISEDGVRSQSPYGAAASWLKYLVLKDPAFNLTTLDETRYAQLAIQATYEFGGLLDTSTPDLSALREAGTKLFTWHGLDDQIIPVRNTIEYRKQVEGVMGGAEEVNEYYRLFLAPGGKHCNRGRGPVPTDPLQTLVDWVERGVPPRELWAKNVYQEAKNSSATELWIRNLCLWPQKQNYVGGNARDASSWTCTNQNTVSITGDDEPQVALDE
ncbi:tannase and feruloyl esterase [Decorospora gaudefroyi]|uniref:Carboxylic ester hydrolase n=1 Tax=Decorospora gaudefroyi TaxID=184978 RepID=A0A6A5JZS8_9PLEO|nr:tannase and feruloyl esterase [Decorospora gaudefroyi]